ncbi:MAG: hypothetical protein ACI86H_001751, partial [bacterium]
MKTVSIQEIFDIICKLGIFENPKIIKSYQITKPKIVSAIIG